MFPSEPYSKQKIDFIYGDLTNLTRKDLTDKIDEDKPDGRQRARKQFNHPKDSLMAMIYSTTALEVKQGYNWVGTGGGWR